MNYEIRKNLNVFTLYHAGTEVGELEVALIGNDITGKLNGYGAISFIPKGFSFWLRWHYIERDKPKYIFKSNSWRTFSLVDNKAGIELHQSTVKIKGKNICSIEWHINDIDLNIKFVKNLFSSPKRIYDELTEKPMCSFKLENKEYLPLVFTCCVQERVRSMQ